MADPLDPLEQPQPGDPMLDAVEESIVRPQGFEDSLAGRDDALMDPLGRRLGDLEASGPSHPRRLQVESILSGWRRCWTRWKQASRARVCRRPWTRPRRCHPRPTSRTHPSSRRPDVSDRNRRCPPGNCLPELIPTINGSSRGRHIGPGAVGPPASGAAVRAAPGSAPNLGSSWASRCASRATGIATGPRPPTRSPANAGTTGRRGNEARSARMTAKGGTSAVTSNGGAGREIRVWSLAMRGLSRAWP
jgi:hypothetical protein